MDSRKYAQPPVNKSLREPKICAKSPYLSILQRRGVEHPTGHKKPQKKVIWDG
jgi:hypothetical protein